MEENSQALKKISSRSRNLIKAVMDNAGVSNKSVRGRVKDLGQVVDHAS